MYAAIAAAAAAAALFSLQQLGKLKRLKKKECARKKPSLVSPSDKREILCTSMKLPLNFFLKPTQTPFRSRIFTIDLRSVVFH